ncbi:ABC transporter permease [Actinophytocola sp.]|uniref:ABC transporter permease n=1 Tax=Actinophytocola sp. TaxID=1872138 RepID=UPI002D7F0CA0|nr:ABC transporter permease [Actinophytocola sp.]HET9138232.1 ABC transporter permease [Actinophytocola sp.]HEU5107458.1 ABC transporter permease [Micromonosporaceae bacterium]
MTGVITGPVAEPVAAAPELPASPGRRRRRVRELHVHLVLLAFLVLVALAPDLVTWHDPYELDGLPFTAPTGEFWFGTDEIGRDLFSRVVHGLPISLFSALLAVAVALAGGAVIGVLSGLRPGGLVDRGLGIITEAIMAIPAVLLALAVITTYGRGAFVAAIAIGIGEATGFARLIRGCVIQSGTLTYVEAARTCGAGPVRVVTRHIIPSSYHPVLSYTALHFGLAMLAIGSLSYLGFGEAPPSAEWGVLIAGGQKYLAHAWWVAIIPGLALTAVVVLLSRIAYLLQEDPA